jgi:hypothetical protein
VYLLVFTHILSKFTVKKQKQYRFICGCVFGAKSTVTIIIVYGVIKETMMASVLVTSSLVNDFADCGFIVKYGYNLLDLLFIISDNN